MTSWLRGGALFAGFSYLPAAAWVLSQSGRHKILMLLVAQVLLLLPGTLAWIWVNRTRNSNETGGTGPNPTTLLVILLLMLLGLSLGVQGRVATGDESAYSFQARILASGRIAADAPPPTSVSEKQYLREFRYHHHIIDGDKWFAKYFPGWPAILAVGELLRIGWLVSPLFGLVILWSTYRIASRIYDEQVSRLAILFLVASPYFTLNCMGFMSHPSCSAFLAVATLFLVRGLESRGVGNFVIMLFCLGGALLIRPSTTAFVGGVLGLSALWALRRQPSKALFVAAIGIVVLTASAALLLFYNRELTGSFTRSTYALYFGTEIPPEITSGFRNIPKQILIVSRWSMQATMAYAFPFLLILAVYALVRDARRGTRVLGALFVAILLGRFFPGGPSGSLYGERYYFETFFAVAILGSLGWSLLCRRWNISQAASRGLAVFLLVVQGLHYAYFTAHAYSEIAPYRRVAEAVSQLKLSDAVVFLRSSPEFTARDMNLNSADWARAPLFLMEDPGADRRSDIACALGRARWIVLRYDESAHAARLEERASTSGCTPALPVSGNEY